jgi:hypothetical protein
VKDPRLGHSYRTDANYYRLLYQLSAQQLNGALDRDNVRGKRPTQTTAVWRRRAQKSSEHRWGAQEAIDTATKLVVVAEDMLLWFDQRRDSTPWWKRAFPDVRERRPPLTKAELRLERFLRYTIVPCGDLVIALALLEQHRPVEAEKRAARPREQADKHLLSYRALYNVACFEVARGSTAGGMEYLRQALREARGRRRQALVRWARKDPSLKSLHRTKDFRALLARFEIVENSEERA